MSRGSTIMKTDETYKGTFAALNRIISVLLKPFKQFSGNSNTSPFDWLIRSRTIT